MSTHMREVIASLSKSLDTSIVTGRSRDKILNFVKLDSLYFAASHGFDIVEPHGGATGKKQVGTDYLPLLAQARDTIGARLEGIEGAFVEDNRFSVSVHYRMCPDHGVAVPMVRGIVDEVLGDLNGASSHRLRLSPGKCVFELSPDIGWNKGEAVNYLMDRLGYGRCGVNAAATCVYIGDDTSDEHAFGALGDHGVSVLVSEHAKETQARYHVKNPEEVGLLLQHISQLAASGRVHKGPGGVKDA